MTDRPRAPARPSAPPTSGTAGGGSRTTLPGPAPAAMPPPARGRSGTLPPSVPETKGGVVRRASSSSYPPPPIGPSKALPKLAPPRRPTGDEPRDADVDSIDIALDDLLHDESHARGSPSTPAHLPAICLFGRYEILGRLAFGGMAEIFLGRELTATGAARHLVIKRILPHVADEEKFVQMFLDEARLAIQLNHPNICHIYEFGELEGSYFISMEWVDGVPLGKLIRRARSIGGVPIEIGVRVGVQVAEALSYAHRARDALGRPMGIVHRDVTPHNIMVGYDGQVKLLDFGIAKATTHSTRTEAGMIKGKFSYMAPEQCLGKTIDGRADVFALGVCLWEALTGRALYHRETEYETMHAVIHEGMTPIRKYRKDVPDSLDAIIQRALEKDIEKRYPSAGAFQTALEQWLAQERRVVNATTVADCMEKLYAEQIARGPLVDSTPFGQSFQKMPSSSARAAMRPSSPSSPGAQRISSPGSGIGPAHLPAVTSSSPGAPAARPAADTSGAWDDVDEPAPRRRMGLAMAVGAILLASAAAVGLALFGPGDDAPAQSPAAARDGTSTAEPPSEATAEASPETEVAAADRPSTAAPSETEEPPGEAAAPPAAGALRVEWAPATASLTIDGRPMEGSPPLVVGDLPPGLHRVVVTAPGHQRFEESVEVAAGAQASVTATLIAIPRGPASPPATLSINTRPWSKVYVGSRLLGTTPIAEARVPSGSVRLRLVDRDGRTHSKTVRLEAGTSEVVFYDLN